MDIERAGDERAIPRYEGFEQGRDLELRSYLDFLRRRWWLLILGAGIAGCAAYLVSQQLPRAYQASATVVVFNQPEVPSGTQLKDLLADPQLTNTYAQLVKRRPILTEVKRRLGLSLSEQQLNDEISVTPVTGTQLIRISVSDSGAARAAEIANTTAQAFIDDNSTQLGRSGTVSFANEATQPESPAKPNVVLNTAIAVVLGLLIAGGIGIGADYLDDTVKTSYHVESLFGLSTLGVIRQFKLRTNRSASDLTYFEDYRELRTYVHFAKLELDLKTILVASAEPHEGRSTTAANLAIVFAQAGERVILVDADLRRPSLHLPQFFGERNSFGLADLLLRDLDTGRALLPTGVDNLRLLPAGRQPSNPSELLTSARMAHVLHELRQNADFIIIDSPPMSAVTDAGILASRVDGTLIVVEAGRTRSDALGRVIHGLGLTKARIIGVVLNKARSGRSNYGFYGYHEAPPDAISEAGGKPLSGATQRGA